MYDSKFEISQSTVYGQIVYGSYTLNSFVREEDDNKALIEYGFARTRSGEAIIDEPLAIMAAWKWFDNKHQFSLVNCLQEDVGKYSPRKNRFEAYLAFYLRKVFETATRLNDVFTFREDFRLRKYLEVSWQSEQFELVTVSISASTAGDQQRISVVTPLCGPSSNVGFLAKTDDEVLNWISEKKRCYAFLLPSRVRWSGHFLLCQKQANAKTTFSCVASKIL